MVVGHDRRSEPPQLRGNILVRSLAHPGAHTTPRPDVWSGVTDALPVSRYRTAQRGV